MCVPGFTDEVQGEVLGGVQRFTDTPSARINTYVYEDLENPINGGSILFYIITLRIYAISLVESHDLLEDRRTEYVISF